MLRSNSFEIYFNSNGNNECDFILKEKTKIIRAVQVCFDFNRENKEREIKGLTEAMNKFKLKEGLILTYEQEDDFVVDKKKIKVVPVWKWLLIK